jgi:hypothetical protein
VARTGHALPPPQRGHRNPPATAIERGNRDSLLRSRTGPRTLEESADNLPLGDHTTCSGHLSQVHTQFSANQTLLSRSAPPAGRCSGEVQKIANGMVRRGNVVEGRMEEELGDPPPGIGHLILGCTARRCWFDSRTVLGGKGSRSRANPWRALASSAPFRPSPNCDGRLHRESDADTGSSCGR